MSYSDKNDSLKTDEWLKRLEEFPIKRTDMNRLIMNYFVTEGFKEAAENFQLEAELEPTIELNSLDDRILIREAVQSGRIEEATDLVKKLHTDLLNDDRYLQFHMRQLQLIEMIRNGKVDDALAFAQEKLSEAGENLPEALAEMERTLTLLAFEKPEESPFAELLEQSHRQKVASELNAAILKAEHRTDSTPKILFLLKLILWSQAKLDSRDVNYPQMKELATALIEPK